MELCYHCHKCTAGCPVIEQMSYGPDRVLRMVALGEEDALFKKLGYLAVRRMLHLRNSLPQ